MTLFLTGLAVAWSLAAGAEPGRSVASAVADARIALQALVRQPAARVVQMGAVESAETCGAEPSHERLVWVMGTPLRIRVPAAREIALEASEEAVRAVESLEAWISSWRSDSDLGRIAAAPPGTPVGVSRETWRLLREAFAWRERTGGAFDPAIGALIDAWDLRGRGRVPTANALALARRAAGPEAVRLDPRSPRATRTHAAAWLDAGGFGKGAALRSAAAALRARGVRRALLDFGGQLLVLGHACDGGPGWPIAVSHPARRDSALLSGRLLRGSAATSGASERGIETEAGRRGHVLDPRTGRPVPAWGSVTVVADDPLTADVVATALFVLGPEEGPRWMAGRSDVGAVFLVDDANGVRVRTSGDLAGRLRLDGTHRPPSNRRARG